MNVPRSRRVRSRALIPSVLAGAFALAGMAQSAAAAPGPSWNCRASAGYTTGVLPRNEPLVANGDGTTGADREFCVTDDAGPTPINTGGLSFTSARASTSIASVPPANQFPSSDTTAENLSILGPSGALVGASRVTANATASCVGGVPQLSGGTEGKDNITGQARPTGSCRWRQG